MKRKEEITRLITRYFMDDKLNPKQVLSDLMDIRDLIDDNISSLHDDGVTLE